MEYCEEEKLFLPNEKLKVDYFEGLKQSKAGVKFQEIKGKVDIFMENTMKKE